MSIGEWIGVVGGLGAVVLVFFGSVWRRISARSGVPKTSPSPEMVESVDRVNEERLRAAVEAEAFVEHVRVKDEENKTKTYERPAIADEDLDRTASGHDPDLSRHIREWSD